MFLSSMVSAYTHWSTNDYSFFHFLSTAFILCCSLKNTIVIMHCNADEILLVVIAIST